MLIKETENVSPENKSSVDLNVSGDNGGLIKIRYKKVPDIFKKDVSHRLAF